MENMKLKCALDSLLQEAVASLSKAVRIPSVTGHENAAQRFVESILKESGLRVDVWRPTKRQLEKVPHHSECNLENLGERLNLVGTLPGAGGGRSLILNGHIDTVDAFDTDAWRDDPWSGNICDGKLYGRGACDMKGGLFAAIYALRAVRQAGIPLRGDVILESVIGEENGGAGTLACWERGYAADAAVVMEPTRGRIVFKQSGLLYYRLTLKGKAAHASVCDEGVDAIAKAAWLHGRLMEWTARRNRIPDVDFADYPMKAPHIWGKLSAGEWISSVPETAAAEGRFGCLPEEDVTAGRKALETALCEICPEDGWLKEHPPVLEWTGVAWPSYEVPRDHPFVALASESCRKVGMDGGLMAIPYASDAKILYLYQNIPTVLFGPGDIRQAHFPDEFVPLDEFKNVMAAIAGMIVDWCS
jgi:acetylornithine deacetylase